MSRSRTVWKDGKVLAEYENGVLTYLREDYTPPARSETVKLPYYVRDIGEYTSPIDGTVIGTRSDHRDHMKRHDVIEVGNERMPEAPSGPPPVDVEFARAAKRRLDEVKAMPQAEYDTYVERQQREHAQVAELATPTE